MQIFFATLDELEGFTHSLNTLSSDNACTFCTQNDQWVSHGYIYKQRSIGTADIVGKRILCSQRYGKSGCGRSRQLYLQTEIPRRRYSMDAVFAFISLLICGFSVKQAYFRAANKHASEARQAWRWISALIAQLGKFRMHLHRDDEIIADNFLKRSPRLSILLSTLSVYVTDANIQYRYQNAFF